MFASRDLLVDCVRHAFITGDPLGDCEKVLQPPRPRTRLNYCGGEDSTEDVHDDETLSSPDIRLDSRSRASRSQQCHTNDGDQAATRNITWRPKAAQRELTVAEVDDMFPSFSVPSPPEKVGSEPSEDYDDNSSAGCDNPFMEYARYESSHPSLRSTTKSISVLLPAELIQPTAQPHIAVLIAETAKVADLIGYVLYRLVAEGLTCCDDLSLESLADYAIHTADDHDEIDEDLPALDNREPIGHFGFPLLALVKRTEPLCCTDCSKSHSLVVDCIKCKALAQGLYAVSVRYDYHDPFVLTFRTLNQTRLNLLKQLLLDRVKRTGQEVKDRHFYQIEKTSSPGEALDEFSTIAEAQCLDYYVVLNFSVRCTQMPAAHRSRSTVGTWRQSLAVPVIDTARSQSPDPLDSCHFFPAKLVQKLRTDVDFQLGICSNRVEFIPKQLTGQDPSKRFNRMHPPATTTLRSSLLNGKMVVYPQIFVGGCEPVNQLQLTLTRRSLGNSDVWRTHTLQFHSTAVRDEVVRILNEYLDVYATKNSVCEGSEDPARQAYLRRRKQHPTAGLRTSRSARNLTSLLTRRHYNTAASVSSSVSASTSSNLSRPRLTS